VFLRNRNLLLAAALFILAVATYIPSMTNGFIWDDPAYVVDNPTLKSVAGLWDIWTDITSTPQYYPMVHTTFWIEARLWGTDHAAGFHVDNILLHAIAAVLLWRALVSLEIPSGWLAAAIFAVHPVMVESVTWVTERKNVLSIVFYLLAFHAYRRSGLMTAAPDVHSGLLRRNRWYLCALAFFLLALLSKTVTCSLPAAILLVLWWKHGRLTWRAVKPLLPMFVIGLALSSLTSHLEHTRVGARGPDFSWSPIDRCLIAGRAICFYASKIVWPHPLMFMYPKWDLHADRAMQFIYPAIVFLIVTALWFTRRWIGRGPLVAVLFFIGTLVPALGFVNVYPMRYSFVADHFQYLASLGLIALIAAILARAKLIVAGFALLIPLTILTWRQQLIYKNAHTLWQNTIDQNETCWMAHVNMAGVFNAEKNLPAAIAESRRALQLAPAEADTNYDMGVALALRADWPGATAMFRRAIECDASCAPAWSYLARVLWEHSDTPQSQAEAYTDALHALQLDANLADPHYVLARVAEFRGDLSTAISEYGKALAINNQDYHSHYNLGNCLLQSGHPGEAAGEYQIVLAHDPRDAAALTNLGYANLNVGRIADAARCFHLALSIKPGLTAAQAGLRKARSE
jgi:tetratricopeptide (TPR) repeat protein